MTAAEAERGLAVVVPAPWEALSGGSTYDRRLVTALRARGARVRVEVVRGAWPRPSPVERAALAEALVHPDGADVVVDGLLAAAAPAEVRAAVDDGVRVHALVHLPLALETGLDPAVAAELDRCEAASLRAATSVLATSSWAADELRHRHGLVDVGVARPGTEPAPVARGSRHRVPQLLQLASVRPVKDQLGVVAALGRLRDLRWTAVLAGPVGDAGYAAAVDAAVGAAGLRGRVRLAGPVVGDELERLWDATDLLLLPSRAETWGMVVTESLARGIPAVVSAGTGAVEALGGARAGALPGAVVAPADPEQLSTAVRRLLGPTGAAARAAAGVARRQLARGGGWDSTAGAVLDHLRAGRRPDRRPTDDRPTTDRRPTDDRARDRPVSDGATPTLTEWLALRGGADERARRSATPQLLRHLGLGTTVPPQERLRVVDVGAGTGANLRHLAPVLARVLADAHPQRRDPAQDWLLLDHDPEVLRRAAELLVEAPVGARTAVATRLGDLAEVDLRDSADLLTCTALLDVLRADQVDGLVGALEVARVPALMALTVTGGVQLDPPHPADAPLARAFDDHQQRGGRLGPRAAGHAVQAFGQAGFEVLVVPTPWRLGPEEPELLLEWAAGRVEAAAEQDPSLAGTGRSWLRERSAQVAQGRLRAVVHHVDLAARPPADAPR